MRTVYEAANLIDAHLVRQVLEQQGIPAFVRGEALTGGIGELSPFDLVSVSVPDSAWPKARSTVEWLAFGTMPAALDDAADAGDRPCPA